jgi:thioesterase domain-containing protein
VHPASGLATCYRTLAAHVDAHQPVYGLQAYGFAAQDQPLTTVEEMAAAYVREILQVQTESPYYLLGWSLGATVAYEMAQQLRAAGRDVALLALLDSEPCDPLDEPLSREELDAWERRRLEQYVEGPDRPSCDDGVRSIEELRSRYLEQLRAAGDVPAGFTDAHLARLLRVWILNERIGKRYRFTSYPGAIVAINSTQTSPDGWRRLAGGGLDVLTLDAPHERFMTEPHVSTLAGLLRPFLPARPARCTNE